MLIKNYRTAHSEEICTIPFANIYLIEEVHIKGVECGHTINTQINNPVLIVRKIDGEADKYALISGYNAFCIALMNHTKEVNAIIVSEKSRKAFFKNLRNLPEMVEVTNIKTPRGWTPPRSEKVDKCIARYNATGTFGKKVIIDEHNEIMDGYAAVVAAQKLGIEKIFVVQMSRNEWVKSRSKKKRVATQKM